MLMLLSELCDHQIIISHTSCILQNHGYTEGNKIYMSTPGHSCMYSVVQDQGQWCQRSWWGSVACHRCHRSHFIFQHLSEWLQSQRSATIGHVTTEPHLWYLHLMHLFQRCKSISCISGIFSHVHLLHLWYLHLMQYAQSAVFLHWVPNII